MVEKLIVFVCGLLNIYFSMLPPFAQLVIKIQLNFPWWFITQP